MTAGIARLSGACLLVCTAVHLAAQDCHVALRGKIMEAETHTPLAYATIVVEGTGKGTNSDENGAFVIPDLCEGTTYTVSVNHVECEHQTQIVQLTENTEQIFYLHHHNILREVLITETAVAIAPTQSGVTVSGVELEATQGINLGAALKQLPGVTTLNTGVTVAKPVIQGLHSNRIAIIANQVPLESQQWGVEHAPEVDPFSAEKITVVKGAAGVRYGVGAIAGAVVLEPAPLRKTDGLGGWASLGGFSNGRSGVAAGSVDWRKPGSSFALRLQGTAKRSGNLHAPGYWMANTGTAEYDLSTLTSWKNSRWTHEAAASLFSQKLGILRASHIGNLSDLQQAINSPVPLNNEDRFYYTIDRPYQQIRHFLTRYKLTRRLSDKWKLSGQHAFQFNNRQEFDVVRQSGTAADKPQLAFRLWTNTLDLALEHFPIRHWEGGIGVQGIQQLNYVGKGGLIPDYRTFGGSVWLLERWRRFPHPWEYEIGLRYDYRQTHATTSGNLANVDTLVHFGNVSGTGGLIYHITRELKITLNSGFAWRPPHVNELFARGVHHGAATYEEGRADLKPEKAWNSNLSLQYQHDKTDISVSLYRNQLRDFIYLDPQRSFVLTVRGAFPAYFYAQADAVLQGLDASASIPLFRGLAVEGRASLLRGYRLTRDSGESVRHRDWLPLMPADRFQYGVRWELAGLPATYIRLMATTALEQTRIPEQGLLKPPPAGYTLFSLDAGHTIRLGQAETPQEGTGPEACASPAESGQSLEIGLTIQNLGNATYREYLNFFRFFTDEPGINIGLRLKWRF
ncbi:MAG: TonB-dependent receptor [Bacteroidetes bacterium]|nr:MAG: TonB-dependent receptor [Bacteroidota bacterium]